MFANFSSFMSLISRYSETYSLDLYGITQRLKNFNIQHFKDNTISLFLFFHWSSFPSWVWIRTPSLDRGLRTRMNPDPVWF
jgi:hypothetical protein